MHYFRSKILIAGFSSLMLLTACHAQDGSTAANGAPASQSQFDFLLKQSIAQGQADTPELRKNIRENLTIQELAVKEAEKKGLDKTPDVATQIDLARQNILVRAYLQDYVKNNPISDDALKAEYNKIKAQLGDKEYHARHILVDKESEAKDIIAQLKKSPAKFEKLAAQHSKDGSKSKGGDLGWVSPANLVKPFADAMVKLQKGQITTEPVQTQFGWHVIKLEDTRPLQSPPFEKVKDNLSRQMQQQQVDKAIGELKAKAKIQ